LQNNFIPAPSSVSGAGQAKTTPSSCTNAIVRLADRNTPVNLTISADVNVTGPYRMQ
jgi:hypothetical protein